MSDRPLFLCLPWIPDRSDYVYDALAAHGGIALEPFRLFDILPPELKDGTDFEKRSFINNASVQQPQNVAMVLRDRLLAVDKPVHGIIFTFDWSTPMHILQQLTDMMHIPTAVVLHEGVFADESLYYRDPVTGVNYPQGDINLVWGSLHQRIFTERGADPATILPVGSIKLDGYRRSDRPAVDKAALRQAHNIPADKPVLLFASQPMDLQYGDEAIALRSQAESILDAAELAKQEGWTLLLRLPPARDEHQILGSLSPVLRNMDHVVIDPPTPGGPYAMPPEDALALSDMVFSISSTMLMEAALLDIPAVQIGYLDFDPFWHRVAGMPLAKDRHDLAVIARRWMGKDSHSLGPDGFDKMADAFSVGSFDGQSVERIIGELTTRFPIAKTPGTWLQATEAEGS